MCIVTGHMGVVSAAPTHLVAITPCIRQRLSAWQRLHCRHVQVARIEGEHGSGVPGSTRRPPHKQLQQREGGHAAGGAGGVVGAQVVVSCRLYE